MIATTPTAPEPTVSTPTEPMHIAPGAPVPFSVPAGRSMVLLPGVHDGALFVEAALVVDGAGATLDAHGRGATVHAAGDEGTLTVRALRVRGGRSELGAALRLDGDMAVEAVDCVFEAGLAAQGGDAVGAIRGSLRLERCVVHGELMLTGIAEATLIDCVVQGDIKLREAATLQLIGGAVHGAVDLRGTSTRAPTCAITGAEVATLRNDPRSPGAVQRG